MFFHYLFNDTTYYFSWVIVVMFSICVHEYAHARVALAMGDSTAADNGHLTLNPLIQMGISSIIMLCIIGIAWGAVPVDPGRMRTKWRKALVSFSGPLANLILSMIFALLFVATQNIIPTAVEAGNIIGTFFYIGAISNSVLFIFNMLPVPMFDGWSVFALFFPAMENISPEKAQRVSFLAIALILLSGAIDICWALGELFGTVFMTLWTLLWGLLF